MLSNTTESEMLVFGSYTTVECAYKLLEEMAELYGAWETLYKNECSSEQEGICAPHNYKVLCSEQIHLAEELYDVLQVCVNISARIGNRTSFEGRPRKKSVDKEYMRGMLGGCAEVFHYILHCSEKDRILVFLESTVRDVFTIAYAYGVDMAWAISVGTDKNVRRGRISKDA